MVHRTRIKDDCQHIVIDGNPIIYTKNTKFLEVIIDHKLNWSDHILYIKNKISKSIGIINKTRNLLDKNTLRNLYFTFIYLMCGGSVVSTRMLLSSHYLHDYSDFYSDFGINSFHTFV